MSAPYLQHPLSAAFPRMSEADHAKLTEDIRQHGQRDPIIMYEGQVLDGWHRYQSCLELGITPRFQVLPPETEPAAYVISCNLHRRHLTPSQRAEAVAANTGWLAAHRPNNSAPGAGLTTKAMAEIAAVGTRTIEYAKAAHTAGLGDAVRDGKITAKEGAAIAKLPVGDQAAAVANPAILKVPKGEPQKKVAAADAPAHQIADEAIDVLACIRKDDSQRVAALIVVRGYIASQVPDGELVTLSREEHNHLSYLVDKAETDQKALEAVLGADDALAEAANQIKALTVQVATLTYSRDDYLRGMNDALAQLSKSNTLVKALEKQLAASHDSEGMPTCGCTATETSGAKIGGKIISALLQYFSSWRRS